MAMVHTASTSQADQPHVPGARAVRVVGFLLILQGGFRLYGLSNTVVLLFQHRIAPSNLLLVLFLSAVIGLLTIVAGVLLVRQDRAGRGFGLVVCSIALANQVLTIGSTVAALKLLTSSAAQSPAVLFLLVPPASIILFLVGIIVIARWHPPQLPG
jgi:hypothetical protein